MRNSDTKETPVIDFQKELEIRKLVDFLRVYETADFVSSLRIECELHHAQQSEPLQTA